MRFFLRVCTRFLKETACQNDRFHERFNHEVTAKLFHNDHGFNGAAAKTTQLFSEWGCEQAQFCELCPYLTAPAVCAFGDFAACVEVVLILKEALHRIPEQCLFLAE